MCTLKPPFSRPSAGIASGLDSSAPENCSSPCSSCPRFSVLSLRETVSVNGYIAILITSRGRPGAALQAAAVTVSASPDITCRPPPPSLSLSLSPSPARHTRYSCLCYGLGCNHRERQLLRWQERLRMNGGYFAWSGCVSSSELQQQVGCASQLGGGGPISSAAPTNTATANISTSTALPKVSWTALEPYTNVFDHSSLLDCTSCIKEGHFKRYRGSIHGFQGNLNIMDGELVQDLQYTMEDIEDDVCIGMDMKIMKKRKLTSEQARQLEASFEADKKLEAEKKQRLAEQLGLQPRQVAVWFQNRRARSKTKQLELDFLTLKEEYDRVIAQRHSLQAEIAHLSAQLQAKSSKAKTNSCSQDSASSNNSNNGDVVSKSPTLQIMIESPKEDREVTSNSNQDIAKSKDGVPRLQDFSKSSNPHNYDWEPYDNSLWVFD